jgi:membrane protein required for colicin V production
MIWVDWALLGALAISIVIGIFRGFTREVLGLASWILAIVAALLFAPAAAVYLEPHISVPSMRIASAYGLVFFTGLVLGAIVTAIVSALVRKSPLSGIDRSIGAGFGLLRGVLLAVIIVWLVGLTPARQDPWWRESLFIGKLEWLAQGLNQFVPVDWQDRLKPAVSTARTGSI